MHDTADAAAAEAHEGHVHPRYMLVWLWLAVLLVMVVLQEHS